MLRKQMHEDNRLAWNAATQTPNSRNADEARSFREGGNTLCPEEIELLGEIRGKSLVHLQCNSGQGTLCMARLGAVVTGVDISDTAIDFARRLSAESGIAGTFHRADVYDWLEETGRSNQRFDLAFSSFGFLCWLSDIRTWANGVAAILKPGGHFVLVEYHPFAMSFDEELRLKYPYMNGESSTSEEGIGQTTDGVTNFRNPHRSHEFFWGIGDVVSALLEAGLILQTLREYPYTEGYAPFTNMRSLPGGRRAMPEGMPNIPLMVGLSARKDL